MSLFSMLATSLISIVGLTILLALVGKVPINYSIRNLIVRWPISLMTALAFTMECECGHKRNGPTNN